MTENKNNRYANSKVYKLVDDDGYYYYGSTCLPLHKRLYNHKTASKTSTDRKIYSVFTYERLQNVEIKIILVKQINLNTKKELLREENIYIEQSLSDPKCLNSIGAVLDYEKRMAQRKAYEIGRKDVKLEYNKKWYEDNKEKVAIYKKEYRNINIEHIKEYDNARSSNQERRRKREEHACIHYTCICGASIRHDSKSRHEKTKIHMMFIQSDKIECENL